MGAGLIAGALSGLISIGGEIVIVPSLVFLYGLPHHQTQGTTLTLLIPLDLPGPRKFPARNGLVLNGRRAWSKFLN